MLQELTDLLTSDQHGLYCSSGNIHIDPWRAVSRAIITHAHSDHARAGSEQYWCEASCAPLLRRRLGDAAAITTVAYGETFEFQNSVGQSVRVSLHPAGHVLGSAQVRVESDGEVWVCTGDCKRAHDPTCLPFEPVACDGLIIESTFGLPVYKWPEPSDVANEINEWWRDNQAAGRTSVLYGYSLGKAQRLQSMLDERCGPILVHSAVAEMNRGYCEAGVALPQVQTLTKTLGEQTRGKAMVIAPPAAEGGAWLRPLGAMSTAMASGWMAVRGTRRYRSVDRGFVVSDHADWAGLHWMIKQSGAKRVGVTHGYVGPMVRYLREQGLDAFAVNTRYEGDEAT